MPALPPGTRGLLQWCDGCNHCAHTGLHSAVPLLAFWCSLLWSWNYTKYVSLGNLLVFLCKKAIVPWAIWWFYPSVGSITADCRCRLLGSSRCPWSRHAAHRLCRYLGKTFSCWWCVGAITCRDWIEWARWHPTLAVSPGHVWDRTNSGKSLNRPWRGLVPGVCQGELLVSLGTIWLLTRI